MLEDALRDLEIFKRKYEQVAALNPVFEAADRVRASSKKKSTEVENRVA